MPYFYKENEINVLFIHIPKTGGTSIEQYFSHKYKIPLIQNTLFSYNTKLGISLQHYTYENIIYNPNIKIHEGYKTLVIVRNPYHRIVSDIFFLGLANVNSSPDEICNIIKNKYFILNYDNHPKPQYEFIYDMSNNCLYDNIQVLKMENLKEEMHTINYTDFDIHINKGPINNHMYYLTSESINIINKIYAKDFEYFSYNKL